MAKPKVVSLFEKTRFTTRFPEARVLGNPGHLFLECRTFDLQIPVSAAPDSPLDVFQETVLRMLNLRLSTAEELVERLCLPADLINRILLQLQGGGFLADACTLSERGEALLNFRENQEIAYQTAKLFCLPGTGRPLPYLHLGELSYADVVDYRSGIKLEFGSPSDPYRISGKYLPARRGALGARLSMKDCRQAIRVYNQLAEARGKSPVSAARGCAIEISSGEPVYFHLQAAVQQGNVDNMLVSDGFVSNVDGLEDYINEENPQLLADIREAGAAYRLEHGVPRRYRKLEQRFEELRRTFPAALAEREEALCRDAAHQNTREWKQGLQKCGQFLEWTFYYYTLEHPVSSQTRMQLEGSGARDNRELLMELLRKTGLPPGQDCEKLFAGVDRSRIRSVYEERVPTLPVCLSLAVAEAAEHGGGALARLGSEDSEVLTFLSRFSRKYAELRHSPQADCFGWDLKETAERCGRIAAVLLPELTLEGVERRPAAGNFSEERLAARVALERQMGSVFFAALDEACQDEWISISPGRRRELLPEPCHYVNTLYRLLQQAAYDALASCRRPAVPPPKAEILRKARENLGGPLPEGLNRVSEKYLHQAMRGESPTLGAVSVALLASAEPDLLARLKEEDFAGLSGHLAGLRGHGNNVALWVEETELDRLRERTMVISKILGGF